MTGKILIMPRHAFEHTLAANNITDETVEDYTDSAFISIQSSKVLAPRENPYFTKDHSNVLTLTFDDLTDNDEEVFSQFPGAVLFNDEHAKKIIAFVRVNKKRKFIIHCTAGISRSGAVGSFIQQVLRLNYQTFMEDNPNIYPNSFILKTLNLVYNYSDSI